MFSSNLYLKTMFMRADKDGESCTQKMVAFVHYMTVLVILSSANLSVEAGR